MYGSAKPLILRRNRTLFGDRNSKKCGGLRTPSFRHRSTFARYLRKPRNVSSLTNPKIRSTDNDSLTRLQNDVNALRKEVSSAKIAADQAQAAARSVLDAVTVLSELATKRDVVLQST